MVIKILIENNSFSESLRSQHGLSLYIETRKHKILFDLGQNELLLENARKMNVDVSNVDTVVISHGHYDHGGGLRAFLEVNTKARIYIHEKAFEDYYSIRSSDKFAYIGLDKELKASRQVIFTTDYLKIDQELELFSNCPGKEMCSSANKALFMGKEDDVVEDDFLHEQNLIIKEEGKIMLITGCSHKGIVNILEHFRTLSDEPADYVIGGFHLYNPSTNEAEESDLVKAIGDYLIRTKAQYYTCHCTGVDAFRELQEIMKDKIQYLPTGNVVVL